MAGSTRLAAFASHAMPGHSVVMAWPATSVAFVLPSIDYGSRRRVWSRFVSCLVRRLVRSCRSPRASPIVGAISRPSVLPWRLAIRAASSRQMAIKTADMNTAWEASAAAAGALLMLERAQEDLRKLTTPPGL